MSSFQVLSAAKLATYTLQGQLGLVCLDKGYMVLSCIGMIAEMQHMAACWSAVITQPSKWQ